MENNIPKMILVVMGVSGSGKSTIARLLSKALGWEMREGDDLHPAANIEKMRHRIPLDDEDRRPWLAAIAQVIDTWRQEDQAGIITCSALKGSYRESLAAGRPEVCFIYLQGSKKLIQSRLAHRAGHFMPPELLDSQFADLEAPTGEERTVTVDISGTPEIIAEHILSKLRQLT
ncbi:gluconokinase [Dongia soli]|uniref:Gluconokinase n=1 Tax=Dongia soli TaxID=600628 RepID=A0ABU5E9Y0_9PROT|nr:gluconokinase [Dongia soli]MDY0882795.1 gluconokinase [Dongia soli]